MRSLLLLSTVLPPYLLAQQPRWENPVRKLLAEGKPVIGATITIPSAEVAAQVSNYGFDFLWIEMEHSPITLETLRNMVLATRGLKAVPFARVPVNELWTAKRVLDAGVLGVVFPFTSTPELARQAVAACKYPPLGRRGAGPGLATFRWPAAEGYYDFADRNAMVIAIIEEKQAVERIEEIAAIPGLDVLFIGTNDLSFSYGHRGNQSHPEVQEAIRKIVAAGKKNGLAVGRPAGTAAQIEQYLKEGFTFFQGPADLVMLSQGAQPLLKALDKSGIDPKKQPLY
ncbi:MAG: aldolase/citrate lyase family protein [Bryobacteraceae bacterium]|nr:aldolase/citrate lyase family protein [Bryobacteraceae bacterium]MDW8378158.1 aldolase/citrate lyase family protein [Bryobacterales bacterium]